MIIYFVRHGESMGAEIGIYQGDNDALSQKGEKQARVLAKRLSNLEINLIFSSPLQRAKKTAEIISEKISKSIEIWEELRETRNPTEIIGTPLDNPKAREIKKLIKENYTKGNWKYSDEETFEELKSRANHILVILLSKKEENIVCVSHAGIIKMILALMIFGEKLTPQVYWDFKYHLHSDNTGITVCKYSENHGWWVTSWNDITHL